MPDLPWFVYAMLLAPLGLLSVAAVYKTLQVRAAREWPSAAGKVVVSKAEVREVRVIDSDRRTGIASKSATSPTSSTNIPSPARKLRNNRVSIGEDLGNFQVAETIAKYPVGAVVTVYYNPLHPKEAVLERDLPKGMWGCLGIGTAIALAIVFGSAIGLQDERIRLHATWSIPNVAAGVAFGAFGAVVGAVCARHAEASGAGQKMAGRGGTIKLSGLDEYRAAPSDSGTRGTQPCTNGRCPTAITSTTSPTAMSMGASQQFQNDIVLGAAAVGNGFSGRRQRQGLGQSRQSVGSNAQSSPALSGSCGCSWPASSNT